MRRKTISMCGVVLMMCGAGARADVVKNISTGWDNTGGAVIDAGQPDPDYMILTNGCCRHRAARGVSHPALVREFSDL